MSLIVMKFGGSSVASSEKMLNVANRIILKRRKGNKVVVVVSAPGDMTDDLIERASEITQAPDDREMDMLLATGEQISVALLSMAIKSKGFNAISLTGPQAGIYADSSHTRARIIDIKPKKIFDELNRKKVVIVAGFQGLNPHDDITTLGRGGSDLTAIALAAALKADACEIYTDVDGVYTANPRICKNTRKLDWMSFDEMLEIAGSGAQVMQARSIEVAKKYNVKIEIKSSFNNNPGTIVSSEEERLMEQPVVSSVTYDQNQAKLSIGDLPDIPGVASKIFVALAKRSINVDMIIQSAATDKYNDISFTVSRTDLKKALPVLHKLSRQLNAGSVIYDDKVVKVSIVGVGMKSHPGIAAKMFHILSKKKINIEMISTSEIKVSCVIKEQFMKKAVRALHKGFIG